MARRCGKATLSPGPAPGVLVWGRACSQRCACCLLWAAAAAPSSPACQQPPLPAPPLPRARALELHPTSPDDCRWLPGARLNAAECCLVGRDPDRPAIVWAEEGRPDVVHTVTLGELSRRSAHVAEALRAAGLQPGGCAGAASRCLCRLGVHTLVKGVLHSQHTVAPWHRDA